VTIPDGPDADLILVRSETTALKLLGEGEALATIGEVIDAHHRAPLHAILTRGHDSRKPAAKPDLPSIGRTIALATPPWTSFAHVFRDGALAESRSSGG
jgi:hypothetical protein